MRNASTNPKSTNTPGRPKDESKRKAILKAAMSLFMSEGVTRTTMDAIASKASVSKITVYNHFGNKDELFLTVVREKCDGHVGQHIFEGLTGERPETELLKIAQCFISMIQAEDSLALYRVILAEAKDNSEINTLFYEQGPQKLIERFGDYLELVEKNDRYSFKDRRKASYQFFSLFKGELHIQSLLNIGPPPGQNELDQLARDSVDFFLKAYKA